MGVDGLQAGLPKDLQRGGEDAFVIAACVGTLERPLWICRRRTGLHVNSQFWALTRTDCAADTPRRQGNGLRRAD
jgi:hypothetical protein